MIVILMELTAAWVPDGAAGMEVPSAQKLTLKGGPGICTTGPVAIAGGNNPSGAQVQTAINTMATNLGAIMTNTTNLGVIDGWQNGFG